MEERRVVLLLTLVVMEGYAMDWSKQGILPTLPIAAPEARNSSCRSDSLLLIAALENHTLWAEQSEFVSLNYPPDSLDVFWTDQNNLYGLTKNYCSTNFNLDFFTPHKKNNNWFP